jgi:uncharacterized secreted protein with C-terminal beta-propeller domain
MKTSTIFAIMALMLLFVACTVQKPVTPGTPSTPGQTTTSELKKFSSADEMNQFLEKAALEQVNYNAGGGIRTFGALDIAMAPTAMAKESTTSGATGAAAPAEQYSQTNVQVQGVDEADIVKNDGKYIYTISGNSLVIVDAYPANTAKIVSELKFKGTPRNMFVNGDRMIVFVDGSEDVYRVAAGDFVPRPYYTQVAQAFVFDISDRANPEKIQNYSIEGYYFDSRMIDNDVYFVVTHSVNYYDVVTFPEIRGSKILTPEVYYWDYPEQGYNLQTVASIDLTKGPESLNAKSFMIGYTATMYVSQDAIYLAAQKPYYSWGYNTQNNLDMFYQAVLPVLPSATQAKVNALSTEDKANWNKISSILEDMYNSMGENEKDALITKIGDAVDQYERKLEAERRMTVIHKITINNGDIEYAGKGEVSGYLLNQFSMDEYNSNLRVATTTQFWTRKENVMYNNVYVLDSGMNVVGKLEKLEENESIYSARFLGDRLYLVTFRRIDPLFVIDLSEPTNPKVLGKLEMPGFSDYLHPYDETHIIGIGKDTKDNEWGGVSLAGLKLALFDVSDVKNPKQVATYHIGGAGTDSEALSDHKAFLFDKDKNLLVIPVREVITQPYYDSKYGYYRENVWQGAYVFGLTPSDGFTLKGKVKHTQEDEYDYWYYNAPSAIRRALYMDDVLYTVSSTTIKANDLNNLDNELASIKLPGEPDVYRTVPDVEVISVPTMK